jgi:thiamine-monophosphate kinase
MAAGGRPGEFELIERYFKPLASEPGAFNLTDDVALIQPRPGEELVLTVDTLAEGIHVFPDDPAEGIAAKALRINLSDLAAKGAEPRGYLLALSLRSDWTEEWVAAFVRGLASDQKTYGLSLLGGDTTRAAGGTTVSITAIGAVPQGKLVRRAGARAGDAVFVSGTIGDAALGLRVRRMEFDQRVPGAEHLVRRYVLPEPRVALAPVLRRHATAALDVSDGLIGDFAHICRASGVTGTIEVALVPLSPPAQRLVESQPDALRSVLTGGDDYEILATVPENLADAFARDASEAGVTVTRIGRVAAGGGPPRAVDSSGNSLSFPWLSFDHFRSMPEKT